MYYQAAYDHLSLADRVDLDQNIQTTNMLIYQQIIYSAVRTAMFVFVVWSRFGNVRFKTASIGNQLGIPTVLLVLNCGLPFFSIYKHGILWVGTVQKSDWVHGIDQ